MSDFQEIQKIRSAILGKANCRIQELPHMLGFTHTGPIGIMIIILYCVKLTSYP